MPDRRGSWLSGARMSSSDSIPETAVAEQLGLPREELKRLRGQTEKGVHWLKTSPVSWTPSGVAQLKALLGNVTVEVTAPAGLQTVPAQVVRCNFRNRRFVEALVAGAPRLVRVRDAGLYIASQLFEVRPDGAGWMESRRPRKRGVF